MLTVTFDELEAALAACEAPLAAAEAHGSLCGSLAGVGRFDAAAWVDGLVAAPGEDGDALRTRNLLATLAAETETALVGQDMDFEPLLPGDDEPLERRVVALGEWCAGFLYGLGSGGPAAAGDAAPEAVQEVVRDFGEISRASIDPEESEESNETSYAELVEYLRAATQLAYEELAPQRAAGGEP
jgi:hypothetical protein